MTKSFNQPLVVNREGEIWSPQGIVGHADSKKSMEYLNSIGANQSITTMTSILPTIIEEVYYEMPLADIVDIEVDVKVKCIENKLTQKIDLFPLMQLMLLLLTCKSAYVNT